MDPNVKPQISVDTFDHDNAQFYSGDICSSHKVVDLSYFNMHNWALLPHNEETETSFTKYRQGRQEIELSCNSARHKSKNINW